MCEPKIAQLRDRLDMLHAERDLVVARARVVEVNLLMAEVQNSFPDADMVEFSLLRDSVHGNGPYCQITSPQMGNNVEQAHRIEFETTGELADIIETSISMEHREHLFRAADHQSALHNSSEMDLRLDLDDGTWYVPAGLDSGKAADVWTPLLYED